MLQRGVVRDSRGEWIRRFSENLGICTSIRAELRAVLQGLRMTRALELSKLWLQADSMVIVGMLRGEGVWNQIHKPLILQCKELIAQSTWEIKVMHCYREANQVADRLSNLSIDKKVGVVYYDSPPKEAIDVVNVDVVEVAWPRKFK